MEANDTVDSRDANFEICCLRCAETCRKSFAQLGQPHKEIVAVTGLVVTCSIISVLLHLKRPTCIIAS